MNAPFITPIMEFVKSRLRYFLIVIQFLILIISIYNIINTQSEKYWILAIVLSSLVFILLISIFGNNEEIKNTSSTIISEKDDKQISHDSIHTGDIPDVLEEGWDLPL